MGYAFIAFFLSSLMTAAAAVEVGQAAPELPMTKVYFNGTNPAVFTLASLKGKIVLIDFWGIHCGPCVAAIPHVEALWNAYKDKGLAVIGYTDAQWSEPAKIPAFMITKKMTYPVVLGANVFPKTYGHKGIPAVYLIDHTGAVAWQGHPAELKEEFIDKLIAAMPKTATGGAAVTK